MTGDTSRGEKAQAVFFSLIMVVSMMAIGGAAFAGSAAAQTADDADITVGSSADESSIQDAIDSASQGNTIVIVESGEFEGFTVGPGDPTGLTIAASEDLDSPVEITSNVEISGDNTTLRGIKFIDDSYTQSTEQNAFLTITGDGATLDDITSTAVVSEVADIVINADNVEIKNSDLTQDGSKDGSFIRVGNNDEADSFELRNNNISEGFVAGFLREENSITIQENTFGQFSGQDDPIVISGSPGYSAPPESAELTVANNKGLAAIVERTDSTVHYTVNVQGAVELANQDANVEVFPGTYDESVSIGTQNVTLEGPNVGTPGSDSRTTEAVIQQGVEIAADNVTFDGFEVTNNDVNGIKVSNAPNDVVITNNRVVDVGGGPVGEIKFTGNGINLQFNDAFKKTSTGIEITNNEITGVSTDDTTGSQDADAIGIQLLPRGNDVEDLRIADNIISDIEPGNAPEDGRSEARGISIDTQFTDTSEGERGDLGQPTELVVEGNEIRDLDSEFSRAINLFEDKGGDTGTDDAIGPVNFTIAGNTVENVNSALSDLPGEALFIGGYENLGEDHSVRNNNFLAVVENFEEDSQDGDTLDATFNWWDNPIYSRIVGPYTPQNAESQPPIPRRVYSYTRLHTEGHP